MKKLIITTFVLGLSTSAFANSYNSYQEGGIFVHSSAESKISSTQPQVGNSRQSGLFNSSTTGVDFNSYDEGGILLLKPDQAETSGSHPQVGSSRGSVIGSNISSVDWNSYEEGGMMLIK